MSGSAQECNSKWHGCRSIAALQVPAKPMPCISWYLPHSLCVGGVSGYRVKPGVLSPPPQIAMPYCNTAADWVHAELLEVMMAT